MRDQYFEHGADIGIEGRGDTVEAAFEDAARAMFSITTDIGAVQPRTKLEVCFTDEDEEYALIAWLNALLAAARENGMALSRFELRREGPAWTGAAWGEPWREALERGVEVKGATLTMLSVRRDGEEWVVRCVVDV